MSDPSEFEEHRRDRRRREDAVMDERLRALEEWKQHVERRLSEVTRLIGENTTITKNTNRLVTDLGNKVGAVLDLYTAGKVNAKVIAWITAVLGGIGGAVAGIVTWFHK
jgi:hypothetical protein